jgi:hypothetical protein
MATLRFAGEIIMRLPLIEPVPIDDDYVTAIARIEDCGAFVRIVFYLRATCYETDEPVNVVKRKLLMSYEGIAATRAMVAEFMAGRPPRAPGGGSHLRVAG